MPLAAEALKSKPLSPPTVVDTTAVQSALVAFEVERSKLLRKDQQLELQVSAIQNSLEKLVSGLHTA